MQKKKKVPNFAEQKRAFDQVMEAYRKSQVHITGLGCINLAPTKGASIPHDPARPLSAEFRADVERIVESVVAAKYHQWFWAAYRWFDSGEALEHELFAQRLLGDRRHSWEQRLGGKFVEMGLFPPKKYFCHQRMR
jgi:lauroyl/myristoyl acyltransferase